MTTFSWRLLRITTSHTTFKRHAGQPAIFQTSNARVQFAIKINNLMEELIDQFFADAEVQRLVATTAVQQPLQICFPKEVNVSRFLAWLLDPSQGHGLGDLALQSLLVRAWWNSDDVELPLSTRRFLSPANVQTEGFSSAVVTTEAGLNGTSLDVLVIDASRRRYVAIENKFGASQSKSQLKGYRKELEKLFPDFLGIHILLDSNEALAEDSGWITIGYDWLADFLREAEQRPATASHVRETLRQFRNVIETETEETSSSLLGKLVTDVASEHPGVLDLMSDWSRQGTKARPKILSSLLNDTNTLEGKAILRLFQAYWRRSTVWDQCIRQVQFAPFISAMRSNFSDVLIDPRRVWMAFSLKSWESFIDKEQFDEWFYPAGLSVRQYEDSYQVASFMNASQVRADKRDRLIELAREIRKSNKFKKELQDEQSHIEIFRENGLTKKEAIARLVSQCTMLREKLRTVF